MSRAEYQSEYRKKNRERINKYNREWTRNYRTNRMTKKGWLKQCYDCKYTWRDRISCSESICPNCGLRDIERSV